MGHFISHTGLASGPSIGIAGVGAALSAGWGGLFGWVGLDGGRFVGRVCSLGWIAVEIQHLIYQYKVLKKRGKNFPLLIFFSQTVQMLFSFGAFPGCFNQLTDGPLSSWGSCLDGSPRLVLESCSGLWGAERGFLQLVPSLIVNLINNTMTITWSLVSNVTFILFYTLYLPIIKLYTICGSFAYTIQYNTVQYNTIQYNTIQYNTTQYNTIQYNTIQYNTIQYSGNNRLVPLTTHFIANALIALITCDCSFHN